MDIGQLLSDAISGTLDPQTRLQAEQQLAVAARDHFVPYISMLATALGDASQSVQVRMLAALELKNQLVAKNGRTRHRMVERWLSETDAATKAQIKQTALSALGADSDQVGNSAAQLVAAIAGIELPRNLWPELTPLLVESTRPQQPALVKRSALVAIGYICEGADPADAAVVAQMDGILTAIIQGAQVTEPSEQVRLCAMNALVNSLEFIRRNFQQEAERNYIMQVVCEATQASSEELQSAAFGALSRIMSLYYQYMQPYMEQALFALTVQGMQSSSEGVSCLAVEFWSTVSEEELAIQYDLQEGVPNPRTPFHFAQRALNTILPVVLALLTKQDEDADDDEWNPAMAAGSCLQLLAQVTRDLVVQPTIEFVGPNLGSANWAQREAAVMAFGSILDGPDPATLLTLISQALEPLLQLMNDSSIAVKDTVAWCLGRIAELLIGSLDPNTQLPAMLAAVMHGLRDHPKVRTHCCWTVINMVEGLHAHGKEAPLTAFYQQLVTVLVETSDRPDNEYSARTSAYEALSSLVLYAPDAGLELVMSLSGVVLQRLQSTVVMLQQIVSTDDRQNVEELQVNLLGVLTSIIRRARPEDVTGAADDLMALLGLLLQSKLPNSLIEEDLFICIGAVAGVVGPVFNKYVEPLTAFIVVALKETEAPAATTAVGLVADTANAVGIDFARYVSVYMTEFVAILGNPDARRDLRPAVVSCIGDIAAATGETGAFDPYLEHTEALLVEQAAVQVDDDAPIELMEHVGSLREAILDAHVGIVAGFHDHPNKLARYVPAVLQFLNLVYLDDVAVIKSEALYRTAVGLIGDLASMYPGGQFSELFTQEWVTKFVREAKNPEFSQRTIDAFRWAREQTKKQAAL